MFQLLWKVDEVNNKLADVAVVSNKAVRGCCFSFDLKSELTPDQLSNGVMSETDAYLPADHWSEHEFEGMSDEQVAETSRRTGVSAGAVGPGQVPPMYAQEQLERAHLQQDLARIELVRRGHSPRDVDRLSSGSWWPPSGD